MTKRILLHIGSPKCGSTYLQRVLLDNRSQLARAGISYPHSGIGHPGNAANITSVDAPELDRMFGEADTVILSHEDLFAQPPRGTSLASLADERGIEVQVVAFLRPFSEFIYGDYSQFMKQHFDKFLKTRSPYGGRHFEEFAVDRSRLLAPVAYFRGWSRMFPQRPPIIESHRKIRDVVEPWLNGAEINWSVPRDQTNPSLRMEDCDRIAAAMRDPGTTDARIREMFKQAHRDTDKKDAGRTEERFAWIEALFAKQNKQIQAEFGLDNRLAIPRP